MRKVLPPRAWWFAGVVLVLALVSVQSCAMKPATHGDIEPVSLDSQDPRYSGYLAQVRQMIKEKWGYPCVKDGGTGYCEYKSAKLKIEFGILKDGRVPWVVVQETSGYEIYDNFAANAIKMASPFPPVPPELMALAGPGSKGVRLIGAFNYTVDPRGPQGGR